MPPRNLKDQLAYQKYQKENPGVCGFCVAIEKNTDQIIRAGSSMTILRNRFPYSRWDGRSVKDHLMIVPTRHITSMDTFSDPEAMDFLRLMAEYESDGYSFYIRTDANKSKSMSHLHGHLIATS